MRFSILGWTICYTDVELHLPKYSGITEAAVQELSYGEGGGCGGEELCTAFENSFLSEFCQYGQGELTATQHTVRINNMRGSAPVCAIPILEGHDCGDCTVQPRGAEILCHQALQDEFERCHAHAYEHDMLSFAQCDGTPPEGHIYGIFAGTGEQIGDWFRTEENATLSGIAKCTGVSQHELVTFNQRHPTVQFPEPHALG